MIIDKLLAYFDGTSLPAAQILTSSALDLGEDRDPGLGEPMKVFVQTDSLAGGSGSADVAIHDCATTGGTYHAVATINGVTDAELEAGISFEIPSACMQFTKCVITTSSSNWSAGTVDAYLIKDAQTNT